MATITYGTVTSPNKHNSFDPSLIVEALAQFISVLNVVTSGNKKFTKVSPIIKTARKDNIAKGIV
jgi:hypothetical protein